MKKSKWASFANFGVFPVPGGWCAAAWTPKGLSALVLPQKNQTTAIRKLQEYLPPVPEKFWEKPLMKVPSGLQSQTKRALKGESFRGFKFDLSFLTPFQQRILQATSLIPAGQTRTYGWVARKAGSPRGFRAAGQALNRNPVSLLIPCHRVIAGANLLGGYGGGIDWKMKLLISEGLTVQGGKVINS